MRSLFGALLLLVQLQPVIGTVACLGLVAKPAQEECQMPEHGSRPVYSVSAAPPMSPTSCALATVCAPAPLAIPALSDQLARAIPSEPTSLISATDSPTDFSSAPPLPPPRA